jgi:hypothetical protein
MPKKDSQQRVSAGRQAAEKESQPASRKDIDARQQQLKAANKGKARAEIAAHEALKGAAPRSITETHTLVEGHAGAQVEKVPDLDAQWVTRHPIDFLAFLPQDNAGVDDDPAERTEVLACANQDCSTLLRLPHHQFWSHVVHNRGFQRFKDTYLRHCRRYFDEEWAAIARGQLRGRVVEPPPAEADLARRVFMVLLRMSQPEESPKEFMTEAEFARLIYDEWLWDVPALLDLVVLYGSSNPELTAEMLRRLFTLQPAYKSDLAGAVEQVATRLCETCTILADAGEAPHRVCDALLFALDAAHTLHALIVAHPPATALLIPVAGPSAGDSSLLRALVRLYELSHIAEVRPAHAGQPAGLLAAAARPVLLQLFAALLQPALLEGVGGGARAFEVLSGMHQWVATDRSGQGDAPPVILQDWAVQHGLAAALRRLHAAGELGETQCAQLSAELLGQAFETAVGAAVAATAAPAGGSPDVQMVKEFAGVGHLPDALVAECLAHYGGSVEDVVQALVMENLPPHLAAQLAGPFYEPEPEPAPAGAPPPRTIFDGDRHDVFRPDASSARTAALFDRTAHRGKRGPTEGKEVLDALTAADRTRLAESAVLAVARQGEEEQQRLELERLQKLERQRLERQQGKQGISAQRSEGVHNQLEAEQRRQRAPGGGGGDGDDGDLQALFAEIEAADGGDDGNREAFDQGYNAGEEAAAGKAYDEARGVLLLERVSSENEAIMYDDEYDDALDEFDTIGLDAGAGGLEQLAASLHDSTGLAGLGGRRLAEMKQEIARDNAQLNRTSQEHEAALLEKDGKLPVASGGHGSHSNRKDKQAQKQEGRTKNREEQERARAASGKGGGGGGGKGGKGGGGGGKGSGGRGGGGKGGKGGGGGAAGKGGGGQSTAPRNAQRKEQNKASSGNHNRKKQAAAKNGA